MLIDLGFTTVRFSEGRGRLKGKRGKSFSEAGVCRCGRDVTNPDDSEQLSTKWHVEG